MLFRLGEIAESSIEAQLYVFLTDRTIQGSLGYAFHGDPPKPTPGTICEDSRGIRVPIVAYHTSDDVAHLVSDPSHPNLCKKWSCTGLV